MSGAQPGSPEETGGELAKRVGTATGIKALKNVEGLVGLAAPALEKVGKFATRGIEPQTQFGNKPLPQNQNIEANVPSRNLEQQYGITPEYLEPQGAAENFIQRVGSSAPLAALTGGLSGLGTSVFGGAAAAGAGKLGAGEGLQDIVQLGSEILSGVGRPSLKETKRLNYQLAKVPEELRLAATPIQKNISQVGEALRHEVDTSVAKKIKNAVRIVEDNIFQKNINPNDAKELRSSLYALGKDFTEAQRVKYLDPLTKGINDYFALHAATTPDFYRHLTYADKLHTLENMTLKLPELVGKFKLEKIPGAQYLAEDVIGKVERFGRGFVNNWGARKYLFDTVKSVAKNDPYATVNNLRKLNEYLPSTSSPQQENSKRRFVPRAS